RPRGRARGSRRRTARRPRRAPRAPAHRRPRAARGTRRPCPRRPPRATGPSPAGPRTPCATPRGARRPARTRRSSVGGPRETRAPARPSPRRHPPRAPPARSGPSRRPPRRTACHTSPVSGPRLDGPTDTRDALGVLRPHEVPPAEPLPLELLVQVDVEPTCHEQQLRQGVGDLAPEGGAHLVGRQTTVPRAPGQREEGLRELADLLLELQDEPVVRAFHAVHARVHPADDLDLVGELLQIHRPSVPHLRWAAYSTVTDLARLRGWSTSRPFAVASAIAKICSGTTASSGCISVGACGIQKISSAYLRTSSSPSSAMTRVRAPRARISWMLETTLECSESRPRGEGTTTNTGWPSSMSAIGPCLSSPAAK